MKFKFPRKRILKTLFPVIFLVAAIFLLRGLAALKPEAVREEPRKVIPTVDFLTVKEEPVALTLRSQGTVEARTRTSLTARISGLVTEISPLFEEGSVFDTGDLLLRIDPVPFEAALAEAEAALATAKLGLAQETANSEQALADWRALGTTSTPSSLVLREPQLEKARADVKAAEARVAQARQNLDYTEVRAPYAGRVVRTFVNTGQFVTAQASVLAEIYAHDELEVALPVEMEDLLFFTLDPDQQQGSLTTRPEVELTAWFGESTHSWTGHIERLGSTVNQSSRLGTLIAVVKNGYMQQPPLLPGMYVEATVSVEVIPNAIRVPRGSFQPDNSVYRILDNNTLARAYPEIMRMDADAVIVGAGLEEGDRLNMTPLLFFVEGMEVEPVNEIESGPSGGLQE
jgi:RND family efflux transporter MFP subunit